MKMLNEGAMSDIDLLAKESKDFKTFVKAFQKEYSNLENSGPRFFPFTKLSSIFCNGALLFKIAKIPHINDIII